MRKQKRVLVLLHEADDQLYPLTEMLEEHGIAYDVVHVEEQHPLPAVQAYDAMLAMGGSQHVGDNVTYPYFVPEYALIQRAVREDIPYLGVCLGGQLLAYALGAPVTALEQMELGLVQVELTDAGKADPLYQGLPGHHYVFEWHKDTFALPPAAVHLATNAHTVNQAFRFGRRAYGLQYHIELTPENFHDVIHQVKDTVIAVLGPDGHARLEQLVSELLPTYQRQSRLLFANFLKISGLL